MLQARTWKETLVSFGLKADALRTAASHSVATTCGEDEAAVRFGAAPSVHPRDGAQDAFATLCAATTWRPPKSTKDKSTIDDEVLAGHGP